MPSSTNPSLRPSRPVSPTTAATPPSTSPTMATPSRWATWPALPLSVLNAHHPTVQLQLKLHQNRISSSPTQCTLLRKTLSIIVFRETIYNRLVAYPILPTPTSRGNWVPNSIYTPSPRWYPRPCPPPTRGRQNQKMGYSRMKRSIRRL